MAAQARTVRLSDTMGGLNSTERAGLANAHFGEHGATPTRAARQTKTRPAIIEIDPRMDHGAAQPQPSPPSDGGVGRGEEELFALGRRASLGALPVSPARPAGRG